MCAKRVIKRNSKADEITLDDAFVEFIAQKEAYNLSASTIRNYKLSYKKFYTANEFSSETLTDEILQAHIFKWINSMKIEINNPISINHYIRDIRAFLYWCMEVDREYIEKPFKIKTIEAQEEKPKLFSDEELELLLTKPLKRDDFGEWRTWCMVSWVLATGNRASTICDVKIDDVSFARKEISLGHTKNKKAQIIPLSSSLETVLKEYIRMWRKTSPPNAWLFPNISEEQLTTNAIQKAFARYCNGRGVDKSNIHGLRHNFARGWVRNNGNMFALQKILGHSSLDMTRRYVKLYSEDIKEDYDSYSPLDTIKKGHSRKKNVNKE